MTLVCCGYFIYVVSFIFILILQLQWTNCSLLSRFRYPNEYIAPPESTLLPADLPDDIYENLIQDRPDLEPILAPYRTNRLRRPKLPYIKKTSNFNPKSPVYFEYEYKGKEPEEEEEEEEEEAKNEMLPNVSQEDKYRNVTSRTALYTYRPTPGAHYIGNETTVATTSNDSRRWWFFPTTPDPWASPVVGRCYTCGIDQGDIPRNTICHDMFNSDDWRYRTLARFYRTICRKHWGYYDNTQHRTEYHTWYGVRTFKWDRGLKRGRLGTYFEGCFKRYLDIGNGHTVRGCRNFFSEDAHSFSNNRFRRLELLLKFTPDACISSPHASLTVFSRAVSLYARYHVCVCLGRYCNRTSINKAKSLLMFLTLFILKLFN